MLRYADAVLVERPELEEYLRFALRVAEAAGAATLPFFRAEVAIANICPKELPLRRDGNLVAVEGPHDREPNSPRGTIS